jgi:undecaprenyl-diphosphatase
MSAAGLRLRALSPLAGRRRAHPHAPDARSSDRGRLDGRALLLAFSLAAVGAGAARGLTTTYVPVLLERIDNAPSLIGAVMSVNALAGLVVPVAVGVWSDRRRSSGLGRRLPFMAGGAALSVGGLIAVGLGNASSYLALGLAAAVVYTGLNGLTTAHRAIIADDVADERRPAVTSAQEVAMAVGAGFGVAIGGALLDSAPAAAFALAGVVVVASALPTLVVTRRLRLGGGERPPAERTARASVGAALRRRGPREVLIAQTLWVLAYAALPVFFVLYATDELGLGIGSAGVLPLAFGVFTLVGMALAGRARRERVHGLLVAGAALLGGGLVAASLTGSLALAAAPLAAAALGAGLLTALGFPYFARFVPAGEAGAYSGVFFAGRGVASAVALPLAGFAVELTGTYRAVLWLGGAAAVAIVPLLLAERRPAGRPARVAVAAVRPILASAQAAMVRSARLPTMTAPGGLRTWTPRLALSITATVAIGVALPALQAIDNALFLAVNGLGDGPEWLYGALDPHARNYLLIFLATIVATAAVLRRPRYVIGAGIAVVLAGYMAGAVLEVVKLFVERARPEEVLLGQVQLTHGRSWSHIASFPSGHMIVTAAMATAAATAVPLLRRPLIVYVAAVAFTRVLFGAHFPLDVIVGTALGYELGLFATALLANARLLPSRAQPGELPEPLAEPAAAEAPESARAG